MFSTTKITKRRLVALFVIIILIVAAVAIKIIAKQLNQPVSGTIVTHTVSGNSNSSNYHINLTPTHFTGHFVSFNYPTGLSEITPQPYSSPNLEELEFSAKDTTSWLLAIDVSMPRAKLLSSDSGYVYRADNPSLYKQTQSLINGQTVIIMSDKSAFFNQVAYIMHGSLLVSVTLNGADASGSGPLNTTLDMVLSSLQFL